ncbi:MAG: hypothetical protein JW928_06695 [Candidatus Aureabacteria bacterium]|nr:hypothetical protein [Candidatus Auribacterota bacterium]
MKKSILQLSVLLFLFLYPLAAQAKENEELESYPFNKRYLMAVMPFEDKTKEGSYAYLGNQIADQLINEIFSYGRYRLIEREKLSALLGELQVQTTDYFKNETIDKIGNQLGAELMLVGSIVDISQHTEKRSLGLISKQETYLKLALEARVVHVSTGEIMVISKWTGEEKTAKKQALVAVKDDAKSSEDLIAEAIKTAVKEMAYKIAKDAPFKE